MNWRMRVREAPLSTSIRHQWKSVDCLSNLFPRRATSLPPGDVFSLRRMMMGPDWMGGGMSPSRSGVIYFDGVCGLCNRFVQFVLRYDREHLFRFAPLQGESFRRDAEASKHPVQSDSLVVVWNAGEGRRETFQRGKAVLQVLRQLPGCRRLAALLGLLPLSWLDRLYELVAAHRYRFFGKTAICRKPTGEEKRYFLD